MSRINQLSCNSFRDNDAHRSGPIPHGDGRPVDGDDRLDFPLRLVSNPPQKILPIRLVQDRRHEGDRDERHLVLFQKLIDLGEIPDTPGGVDPPTRRRARVAQMARAVLEQRRIPEPKVQVPALDLDQMNEDLEGGRAFLRNESLDPGEKLTVGKTGESGGTAACGGARRTGKTGSPGG